MADESYIDLYTATDEETGKETEGMIVKGKDVIVLDAPAVMLSPETPLLTEAQDVAGAINELFNSGSGGGDEDDELWEPPEDWIPVPEPGEYEMYFLIEPAGTSKMQINIGYPEGFTGDETLIVDWGNGEVYDYSANGYTNFWYTYTTTGQQYLVKITLSNTNRCFLGINYDNLSTSQYMQRVLIAKLGSGIILDHENLQNVGLYGAKRYYFAAQPLLRYVKINNPNITEMPNTDVGEGTFQNCCRLRRIETAAPIKVLPIYCFENCYSLWMFDFSQTEEIGMHALSSTTFRTISLPKCTSLGQQSGMNCLTEISAPLLTELPEYAFYNVPCIKKVYLPSCISIAANNFNNCYKLTELTVAEGCVIDEDSLTNAYNLEEIEYFTEKTN